MTRCAERLALILLVAALPVAEAAAQPPPDPITRLEATPSEIAMRVGDEVRVTVTGITRSGIRVDDPPIRLVGPRDGMRVPDGTVTALAAGDFALIATLIREDPSPGAAPVTATRARREVSAARASASSGLVRPAASRPMGPPALLLRACAPGPERPPSCRGIDGPS